MAPGRLSTPALALAMAGCLVAPGLRAAEPPGAPVTPQPVAGAGSALKTGSPVYTLRKCLSLAEGNFPKIRESWSKLQRMRAELFEARTAPFSDLKLTAGLGLAPTLVGTAVYSPDSDVSLNRNLAFGWSGTLDWAVPLWTFGKITNLVDAASAQVRVGEHDVRKAKNEVRLAVHQAYYGLQLAQDARALLREAAERIDDQVRRLERSVEEDDDDEIDLLKLRMSRAEVEARASEARRQEAVARANLGFLTGLGSTVRIADSPLRKVEHGLGTLERYLMAARLYRPEINMARAGVLARQAQWRLERARYYPDVALGLQARWAQAPEITDQTNPFVRDDANYLRYGVGLVLRWQLDFLPRSARVARAEAELETMRATERYALGGVGVEVETAYEEARDAARRLQAYQSAVRYARQWLIKVRQGIDVGVFEDGDVVAPAKEYAMKRFSEMSAIYDYNLAMARLALATGWDAVAPLD